MTMFRSLVSGEADHLSGQQIETFDSMAGPEAESDRVREGSGHRSLAPQPAR